MNPSDEGKHEPGPEQLWQESWYFDFAADDGSLGGYVRIGLCPGLGSAWYWACLVGEGRPLVTVIDHDVPLPKGDSLELRADGLWATHTCETPFEHFTLGLESFGVALDDPADTYRDMRGDRTALGFDLEWETVGGVYPYPGVTRYEVPCRVHGEILVGDERIELDGHGERDHSWGVRDWWAFGWVWTAGRLDDGTHFHSVRIRVDQLPWTPGFVLPPGGELRQIERFEPEEELGADGLPTAATMALDDLSFSVEPLAFAPVRLDAPDGRVGRFPRALCRFDEAGGRRGYGWTEWNQPQA